MNAQYFALSDLPHQKDFPGVYFIQNTTTGKLYVGSSKRLKLRLWQHEKQLQQGKHHSPKLQNSWNHHGPSVFYCGVIEECRNEVLFEREQFWIDFYQSYVLGYNSRPRAEGSRGLKRSEQSKEKSRIANRKAWANPELRKMASDRFKGFKRGVSTDLSRKRQSDSMKLIYDSNPEYRARRSAQIVGLKLLPQTTEGVRRYCNSPQGKAQRIKQLHTDENKRKKYKTALINAFKIRSLNCPFSTPLQLAEACRVLRESGVTIREIGRRFKMTHSSVMSWCKAVEILS